MITAASLPNKTIAKLKYQACVIIGGLRLKLIDRCRICQNIIAELEKYEDIVELTERNIESCLSYSKNNPSVPYGAIYLLRQILKSLEENKGLKNNDR